MDDRCPHCGTPLPPIRDAFCGECRADLSETPVRPVAVRVKPPPVEEVASDHPRALRVAVGGSIFFYAILIGNLSGPAVQAKAEAAFGARPLGVPAWAFAAGLLTALYAPMPRAFYHLGLIAEQARRDGKWLRGFRGLWYIVVLDSRYPHLARSQRIVLGTLAYFVLTAFAWVAYTVALGI